MRVVVLGAGICGLVAGLMLARDGHDVTIVERDQSAVPDAPQAAWEDWARDGVKQFRQAHYLQPRGRMLLEQELPDVFAALIDAGAYRFDVLSIMPPTITDRSPRPGDERLVTFTARRPVLEYVLARAAAWEAGLEVRRGIDVTALTTGDYDGVPHVGGVVLDGGEALTADLVVDAMGRRSPLAGWISELSGAPVQLESEDSGFVYYTRYYAARNGGGMPQFRSPPVTPLGTFSILVLPGDNATWSVTLYVASGDRQLKQMRHVEPWEAVVAACPAHRQWLEGEPLTAVEAIGGVVDRYRRLVADGRPAVTGVALLADAWACVNPSSGRGMTLGMIHAQHLRDLLREGIDDPGELALRWDALTETHLTPWYRETVREDRTRLHEVEALRRGEAPPRADGTAAVIAAALPAAISHDPDVFRAFAETRACYATVGEVMARPGMVERVLALARSHAALPSPGPDREQLLALLG